MISVCDHFFDGAPELQENLEAVIEEFPNCEFVIYPFDRKNFPKKYRELSNDPHFWHSLSRYIACSSLKEDIEYVLFLDVDEIMEAKKFKHFLENFPYKDFDVFRLANYWYFREPCYQAEQWEDTPVMVKKDLLTRKILLHKEERNAIYEMVNGKKKRYVTAQDGLPMIHHYSWVRTKEDMLKKVSSWGHKKDQDWVALVESEFSHDFDGEDFIHHYAYKKVPSFVEIDLEKRPSPSKERSLFHLNVHSVSDGQMQALLKRHVLKSFFQKMQIRMKKLFRNKTKENA